MRTAIPSAIPGDSDGVRFQELAGLAAERLPPDDLERLGSVSGHTATVKLDTEVRRELERISGVHPQRLVRTHYLATEAQEGTR